MTSKPVQRVKKTSAVRQAMESLKSYIYERNAIGEPCLPSEAELAEILGTSRLTVREALAVLERDGLITRAHGKSTVINGFVQHLPCRIDTGREIDAFLESKGYSTRSSVLSHCWRPAEEGEAEKLKIARGDELLVVEKVFFAGDTPVALYIDRIPRALFIHEDFSEKDLENSMFALVEDACRCRLGHDVLELVPVTADKRIATLFGVPRRAPILRTDVLEYDEDGRVVMYNTEFYHDQFIRFTVCRSISYSS